MRIIRKSEVVFADEKVEREFYDLEKSDEIKKGIIRAITDIKENAFCGIPIPKKLIPKDYVKKYKVKNLWKYDLPNGWRLVYTIATPNKIEIISVILEWFNHSHYERKFNY
jgi:Txe/YoeB family toxin of Txe-Axe toxin-antitoxin module